MQGLLVMFVMLVIWLDDECCDRYGCVLAVLVVFFGGRTRTHDARLTRRDGSAGLVWLVGVGRWWV